MNNIIKTTLLIFCIGIFINACEGVEDSLVNDRLAENPPPTGPELTGTQGGTDFTTYVAIGNSLTAGFMDGALYDDGQENSLAALIAGQLQIAVENDGDSFDEFDQPDINSIKGFNTSTQPDEDPTTSPAFGRLKLDLQAGAPSPTVDGDPISPFTGDKAALNNFGVPGIQVGQLLTPATGTPGDPAFSPFYARFASSPGTSTILGDAIATQPTFFSLWIGNNDVLGYAISGASNEAIFTSEGDFDARYNAVVDQLLDNTTADGVLISIPPVSVLPFFQAVTWDVIELDEGTATQLQENFNAVNGAYQALVDNLGHSQDDADRRKVFYEAGNNPILVNDPELEDLGPKFDVLQNAGAIDEQQRSALEPYEQSRPLTEGELVTLSAGAVIGTEANPDGPSTIGVIVPLGLGTDAEGDQYYLTLEEQGEIQTRTTAFNTTIATVVAMNSDRLALYDINSGLPGNPNTDLGMFADLYGFDGELGIRIQGQLLSPDFRPNGVFSVDGIHPNIRGNAILANEIISTIEDAFGSEVPKVDVLSKPTVQACAGDCYSQQKILN